MSRFYIFTMLNVRLASNVAGTCLALGSWVMGWSQTMDLGHPVPALSISIVRRGMDVCRAQTKRSPRFPSCSRCLPASASHQLRTNCQHPPDVSCPAHMYTSSHRVPSGFSPVGVVAISTGPRLILNFPFNYHFREKWLPFER